MIVRIRQMENVGRFGGWDAQLSCRNESRLGRLSLVYGRNGAGKSTLVRVLTAAGEGAGLDRERLLGAIGSPGVLLELAEGRLQLQGERWTGPRPKLVAFDHAYVEKNVFIGRRTGKDQRRQLLDLALGAQDVEVARELDALNTRGRELTKQRREHDAAIEAAAHASAMPVGTFLGLLPLVDEAAARAAAEAVHRAAVAADTLARLARPEPLPAMPVTDFAAIEALLGRERKVIGDAVAARVEAHLRERLGGKGGAWVRDGMDFAHGDSCPFCAQPVEPGGLLDMYRAAFDAAYDDLIAQIDAARSRVRELELWWREIQRTGGANVKAFDGWAPLAQLVKPGFDSPLRKKQLDELVTGLAALLDGKRRDAGRVADASGLVPLRAVAAELTAAVGVYNEEIARAGIAIAARVREAGGTSVAVAARKLTEVDAAIRRHTPALAAHVADSLRLDGELEQLKADKERGAARLRDDGNQRLAKFATRMNRMLGELGAEFTIDRVAPERSGGAVAARFTLRVERGELEVATSRDEERLERVLSDGDRSALALAVFLLQLEDLPELAEHIVVFDDPMSAQDEERAERTAAQIARVAVRAAQVIVLGHDEQGLMRVADTWRDVAPAERVSDLALLELDKDRRALVPWGMGPKLVRAPSANANR